MSANCNITVLCSNTSAYSFQVVTGSLSSGNWVVSPQPITANQSTFTCLQAVGVSGTATGAVGQAVYNIFDGNNNNVGTMTIEFSDPYSGSNSCTVSISGPQGLNASTNCPSSGSTITANLYIG